MTGLRALIRSTLVRVLMIGLLVGFDRAVIGREIGSAGGDRTVSV